MGAIRSTDAAICDTKKGSAKTRTCSVAPLLMILTVLGSGTLVPDHRRHSPAFLLSEGNARLLLDCGSGILDGMDRYGVAWSKLTHIALSHFHTDHIGGLAPLMFALSHGMVPARTTPFSIVGPPGLERLLAALAEAYGGYIVEPGFEVSVVELAPGDRWSDGLVDLSVCSTLHTDHSVAYRWRGRAGSVGYTGDTGESPALGGFLAGVDVLIVECAFADPAPTETHLTPSGAAALAGEVVPALVVTTHAYPPLSPDDVPELVRQCGYSGRVRAAYDGMRIVLGRGRPSVLS